jgi:hypothetical protein
VKYLGMAPLDQTWTPTTGTAPHAIPTGGT